jgi:bacteriocin-like protein
MNKKINNPKRVNKKELKKIKGGGHVEVQGHTDEKDHSDYNIALGQKRAGG